MSKLDFYRWRNNDYYLADLVVFVDGEQQVLGTYKLAKASGELRWTINFTPADGDEVQIGMARTLDKAKAGAKADAGRRTHEVQPDPNAQRKAYLKDEIDRTIGHLVEDAHALAEAQARLDGDSARLERLKKELDGILALEARADADAAAEAAGAAK